MSGEPVCINDFEKPAQEFLPKKFWVFFSSGANAEQTLGDSKNAFKRYISSKKRGIKPNNFFVPRNPETANRICLLTGLY